jgi:hypothetical protein
MEMLKDSLGFDCKGDKDLELHKVNKGGSRAG